MIDIQNFEKRLRARKDDLEHRLHDIEHDLDQPKSKDVEDRATELEDDEVMETMGNAGLIEIKAIDAALVRINKNTFGICVDCGEPISKERLDIMPTAVKCRKCM